jgi:hypothetical protein
MAEGWAFARGVVIGSVHKFGYGHKFGGASAAPEDAEGSLAQPHGPFEHRIEYQRVPENCGWGAQLLGLPCVERSADFFSGTPEQ